MSETISLISKFHWLVRAIKKVGPKTEAEPWKDLTGRLPQDAVLHQHAVCDERAWAGGFTEMSCRHTWSSSPAGLMPVFFLLSFVLSVLTDRMDGSLLLLMGFERFVHLLYVWCGCLPITIQTFIPTVWCRDNQYPFSLQPLCSLSWALFCQGCFCVLFQVI